MVRVLLVDDDLIVRMFLKDAVDWEKNGFTIAGDARDGEEALELVQTLTPELILTDISMPRMDGVTLIRQLRQDGYKGVIIALSCHDDFALVKDALKCGADEYLLKNHLSEQSLDEMLETIRQRVMERHAAVQEQQETAALAQKGRDALQRELLQNLLINPMPSAELWQQAGFNGVYRRCAVFLARAQDADDGQRKALAELLAQQLRVLGVEAVPSSQGLLMLLDLTDEPSRAKQQEKVDAVCRRAEHITMQYFALPLTLLVSGVCEGETALATALRQANALRSYAFYGAGVYRQNVAPLQEDAPAQVQSVSVLLQTKGAPEQLLVALEALAHSIEAAPVQPGVLLLLLRKWDALLQVARTEAAYASIATFAQWKTMLQEYPQALQNRQAVALPENLSAVVREAVQYMRLHYTESIGLGHAARFVERAPSYLSAKFKQEMGIGFSEYLQELRLQAVCQRLRESEDTVKQISEEAGFPDYQYFCKTFKKRMGDSPLQYRKQNKA